ncbi:MAG: Flp pilus assembly protein CpaB [Coriobacteriia bacterium]|nr:Flp pilus assembly protein CpaB [Coriobacteriia bacterium]
MSNRQRMLIALACAVVAAVLLGLFLQRSATAAERNQRALLARYGGQTTEVLVARKDLAAGTVVSSGLVEVKSWPVTLLPEGTLLARDREAIIGKRTTAWVAQGEPLVRKRVLQAAARLDALAEGFSAVTISTDVVHALGGEVSCGMRVTLMGAPVAGAVTPIATNIEVLSSSASARDTKTESSSSSAGLFGTGGSSDITWVTLAVPTSQAAQIITAAQSGKLWLVLRSEGVR